MTMVKNLLPVAAGRLCRRVALKCEVRGDTTRAERVNLERDAAEFPRNDFCPPTVYVHATPAYAVALLAC